MNDATATTLVLITLFVALLITTGDPDLIDALVHNLMAAERSECS